jgi:hypothetical protein
MKNGKKSRETIQLQESLLTMNGGMKSVDKPLNKQISQVWYAFNKTQEQIKNTVKKREKKLIKYINKKINNGLTTK